jgi:hypothetical protein
MAAPLLLLRSPASIAEGVVRLKAHIDKRPSACGYMFVLIASALCAIFSSFVFGEYLLSGNDGFSLAWRSGVIGACSISIAIALVRGFSGIHGVSGSSSNLFVMYSFVCAGSCFAAYRASGMFSVFFVLIGAVMMVST